MGQDDTLRGMTGFLFACKTALLSQLPIAAAAPLVVFFMAKDGGVNGDPGDLIRLAPVVAPAVYMATVPAALVGLLVFGLPFHRRAVRRGRRRLSTYLLGGAFGGSLLSALLNLLAAWNELGWPDEAWLWLVTAALMTALGVVTGAVPGMAVAGTGWYLLWRRSTPAAGDDAG